MLHSFMPETYMYSTVCNCTLTSKVFFKAKASIYSKELSRHMGIMKLVKLATNIFIQYNDAKHFLKRYHMAAQ